MEEIIGPRFYACAVGFGWEVRETRFPHDHEGRRIEYFASRDYGDDWAATMRVAHARRDELNEADADRVVTRTRRTRQHPQHEGGE